MSFARGVLERAQVPQREVATVFVGGGTPTLLPSADLVRMLAGVRDHLGLARGAEVTTEANPDSVTRGSLQELASGGFTRVSFGMQSAVPQVLATLERTHDPERVPQVVAWAREAGLQVSLDLIYGTPGESEADWVTSLSVALSCAPDHVSAYALVVEAGTAMAVAVRRGRIREPAQDDLAARYEVADETLTRAGYDWYEVSNWARSAIGAAPGTSEGRFSCRHNLAYWRGDDWWGIGPGAHSHVGGVRWWNVKHPAAYAARVASGTSPAAAREVLDDQTRTTERVMLGVRLREGLAVDGLTAATRLAVDALVEEGLVQLSLAGRLVLTLRGRLLADLVARRLLGW